MKPLSKRLKKLNISRHRKGQVFILATLIVVVYTVSMIAVVTELSINRTKTDSVNLTHMVDEYLADMNYQLEIELFNYIHNPATTQDTVITNLQSFISSFNQYASNKGVSTTINLRLNEFSIVAKQNNIAASNIALTYDTTYYISLNSSIQFQSSNSGSKVSGVFIHYFGINVFVSATNANQLILTQKDFYGNTLKYIAGATFASPVGVTDNNNGVYSYTGSYSGTALSINLPSGLEFLS